MKKVRFLTSVSTADRSYAGGEIASLGAVLAVQWVACGYVELIAETPVAPTAPAAPVIEADAAPAPAPATTRKRR